DQANMAMRVDDLMKAIRLLDGSATDQQRREARAAIREARDALVRDPDPQGPATIKGAAGPLSCLIPDPPTNEARVPDDEEIDDALMPLHMSRGWIQSGITPLSVDLDSHWSWLTFMGSAASVLTLGMGLLLLWNQRMLRRLRVAERLWHGVQHVLERSIEE